MTSMQQTNPAARFKRHALLSAFAVFFALSTCPLATSLLVSLGPAPGSPLESKGSLYSLEASRYALMVENDSNESVSDVQVQISGSQGIYFPIGVSEKGSRHFTFLKMKPGEAQEKFFDAKPVDAPLGEALVKADYGIGGPGQQVLSRLIVAQPPMRFEAKLSRNLASAFASNSGSVLVSIANDSNSALSNVKAEVVSAGESFEGSEFEFESLGPGASMGEFELRFSGAKEGDNVSLVVLFEDSLGSHSLVKVFPPEPRDKGVIAGFFVAAILLLVLLSFSGFGRPQKN